MALVTLRDLAAKPYDLVRDKWRLMLEFIAQRDVIVADPSALVKISPAGTRVTFSDRRSFRTRFRVNVSGRTITVGWGYVDDYLPTIEGITLDGFDADGQSAPFPKLELEPDEEPGDDGRSFVCLRALYTDGVEPASDEPDWLTIAHYLDYKAARLEAGSNVGIEPLAILYWQDGRIRRTRQLVMHNLKHHFIAGERGRHHYFAV